jgi:hypothetical protein
MQKLSNNRHRSTEVVGVGGGWPSVRSRSEPMPEQESDELLERVETIMEQLGLLDATMDDLSAEPRESADRRIKDRGIEAGFANGQLDPLGVGTISFFSGQLCTPAWFRKGLKRDPEVNDGVCGRPNLSATQVPPTGGKRGIVGSKVNRTGEPR